ncbi:MAG: Gfo/Idh/MocA family oxidoreductase, partial [Planctomycetes bacterium]|nr:Gfo/Idh/MocA family oxidoreductase [Planctomycetota bacterium]
AVGMELVAICDIWRERLEQVGKQLGVATYTDYDRFLEHDLDAVVLANYFHEHAPFAAKALRAGKHVMSETAACKTLAEGVELCRSVERSGKVYLFAENYPYTACNIELRRLYQAGEVGGVLYAEGEYIHPMSPDDRLRISPGLTHWRNNTPATYYCTHALAPLMVATDAMPVTVNALAIPVPKGFREERVFTSDLASVILCRMDNDAVFRLVQVGLPGHSVWYRIHGTRGLVEHVRGPGYWGPGFLRVVHEHWMLRPGEVPERSYVPQFPAWAQAAMRAGHGGGDFFTTHYFAEAIRTGRQPYLDVYRGVAMSVVGALGWKSALQRGAPFDVPDFRKEAERKQHEADHWSPFVGDEGPGQPPRSIRGVYSPTRRAIAHARKVWREIGYKGT